MRQDVLMRRTSEGLVSVFDVMQARGASNPRMAWQRLSTHHPELTSLASMHQFEGPGQRPTPIATPENAALIAQLVLPSRVGPAELASFIGSRQVLKRREHQFGDLLDAVIGWRHEVHRQFPVLTYRLDFYVPSLLLAIEFDETEHDLKRADDFERQKAIEFNLSCRFIRVDIRNETVALRAIAQAAFG